MADRAPECLAEGGHGEGTGWKLSHIHLPAWKGHTKDSKGLSQAGRRSKVSLKRDAFPSWNSSKGLITFGIRKFPELGALTTDGRTPAFSMTTLQPSRGGQRSYLKAPVLGTGMFGHFH